MSIQCSLPFLLTTLGFFYSFPQQDETRFEKINIDIDGEVVFDVSYITQDHRGYMWLETNLGLIRYDGLEAKKYELKRRDSSSVSDDYIRSLYVDSTGDLWIGANSGLSRYNPDCDCLYNYPEIIEGHPMAWIRSITEDNNNNIWIGTRNGHLFKYEREGERFSSVLQNPSEPLSILKDRIGNLLVDQNNNLWIGTNSGLVQFNIDSGSAKQFLHDPSNPNSLIDNTIRVLYEDEKGQILIGTFKSGLHIYNPTNGLLRRVNFNEDRPYDLHAPYTEESVFGESPHVNLIHQDQQGDYWIGTSGAGVNQLNPDKKKFNWYDFDLVNPQILWALFEDRQGNIWIGGGMGAGLFKTDIYSASYHVNTKVTNVDAAYESPEYPGTLWAVSHEDGLSKINLKSNSIKNYMPDQNDENSIGHKWVRSAYQEDAKTLWVGLGNGGAYGFQDGSGGIDRLDLNTEEFTHFKLTRDDDGRDGFSYTVYNISEDKEGYLWLGTGPGGVFRSDKNKTEFRHFSIPKSDTLTSDVFLNIVRIDTDGNVWASDFVGEGTLYLYDRQEDQFKPYIKGFKMSNVLIDEKGWYLISTWEKGLIHLNPADRSYTQYTKKDGLPSEESLDIAKGENGIIWVSTRIGPARFDTKTGNISPIGLPKIRYNYRILKASNDRLYMGSNDGLYSFPADQTYKNPYPPQLAISNMQISDKNYLTGDNRSGDLSLSYDQNDIAFRYVGLHFSNPGKNRYKYKLHPLDDEWIDAGYERTVRFANLPPGSYTFQVKASNSDGIWNESPEMVSFTIEPAWWASWWAYVLYVLAVAFFTERIYRFRLSKKLADAESTRLKEVDQLKNSLFTNITHEFRTPLTVIKGMTGAIKSNVEKKQFDELDNALEIIDRNSDGLLNLINEMLDLAKIESGNMELNLVQADIIPYIKYLTQSFHSLAEERGIDFQVHCDPTELVMDIDANKFTVIVTNLLSNAIKFTPNNGNVSVTIDKIQEGDADFLTIKVQDSGLGISKEDQQHIFDKFYQVDSSSSRLQQGSGIGLSLVREFVELMHGSITVDSEEGKGSVFSIRIPVTNNASLTEVSDLVSASSILKSSGIPGGKVERITSEITDKELPLVLIIEDNPDVAHYIKTCLADNHQILYAPNGAIGIEMAMEKIPDIIISDVMMPEKDGFEVCEEIKTNELTDHIPIIMLTARATFEDRLTGLSHGADAYLTKPFEKAELLTRIDQLVRLRKKMLSKFEKTGIERLLTNNVKNTETKFLDKIITLIHEHITEHDFGAVQLAQKLHFSESQLYRKLKAVSGKSTALFIRSIRLQKARELIQTTNSSISEIAYDVGFNDPSYFSRVYKDEFGHAPSLKG